MEMKLHVSFISYASEILYRKYDQNGLVGNSNLPPGGISKEDIVTKSLSTAQSKKAFTFEFSRIEDPSTGNT